MIRANRREVFYADKDSLWDMVTSLENYAWRSDLSKIEVIDSTHFIEITKSNDKTYFEITAKKKLEEYRFLFHNDHIQGTWTGIFTILSDGGILIDFTEEVEVRGWMMKLLAKPYLKTQQKKYMEDLRKALSK